MTIPGRMDDLITITPPGSTDAWGNPAPGVAFDVWAELGDVKASEAAAFASVIPGATRQARIYYCPDITAACTATAEGILYKIVGMTANKRRDDMTLYLARR